MNIIVINIASLNFNIKLWGFVCPSYAQINDSFGSWECLWISSVNSKIGRWEDGGSNFTVT